MWHGRRGKHIHIQNIYMEERKKEKKKDDDDLLTERKSGFDHRAQPKPNKARRFSSDRHTNFHSKTIEIKSKLFRYENLII